jgi:hypothetical protein
MRETATARRGTGFHLARIRELATDELIVGMWVKAVRQLWFFDAVLSNGAQSGPRIGMQKGPLLGVGTGLSR